MLSSVQFYMKTRFIEHITNSCPVITLSLGSLQLIRSHHRFDEWMPILKNGIHLGGQICVGRFSIVQYSLGFGTIDGMPFFKMFKSWNIVL